MSFAESAAASHAVFGPYISLPAGKYTARFRLSSFSSSTASCGYVDVCRDFGQTILAREEFSPLGIKAKAGIFELSFEVNVAGEYEFRVADYGGDHFSFESRSLKMDRDYLSVTGSDEESLVVDEFFLKTSARFHHMVKYGARLSNAGDKLVMTMNGIKMHLQNQEDFQIVDEVHVLNTYNFRTSERCCVIDIGMNVGLSTLYFAGRDRVEQVHSFEPFEAPYRRALKNIELNPELARKIKTYNFGLAADTVTKTVAYDEATTIGTSIHGNGGAVSTTINLRNASGALTEIIKSAKAAGQVVVIKMDCEGSEFEIFDDLVSTNLLSDVHIFMIEWHKWWSAEKTDETLIKHLIKSGFAVFNTTQLHDPFAGMIYAAKVPAA